MALVRVSERDYIATRHRRISLLHIRSFVRAHLDSQTNKYCSIVLHELNIASLLGFGSGCTVLVVPAVYIMRRKSLPTVQTTVWPLGEHAVPNRATARSKAHAGYAAEYP